MNGSQGDDDKLLQNARRRSARRRAWLRGGDASVAARLAQIGVLGWVIVVPMLAGMFLGRWLDRDFHTGLFWTAPCLLLGLGLGCWSAWKWMNSA